jgi:hypothetical protein
MLTNEKAAADDVGAFPEFGHPALAVKAAANGGSVLEALMWTAETIIVFDLAFGAMRQGADSSRAVVIRSTGLVFLPQRTADSFVGTFVPAETPRCGLAVLVIEALFIVLEPVAWPTHAVVLCGVDLDADLAMTLLIRTAPLIVGFSFKLYELILHILLPLRLPYRIRGLCGQLDVVLRC